MDADCDNCLQPPEACRSCVDGSMFIRVEDEIPFGGSDDDEVCYGPLDDCNCSRCAAARIVLAETWIPAKFRRIEKVRWVETGAQLRHNQWRREYARPMRKRMKRLSAMRRQGRGGGR